MEEETQQELEIFEPEQESPELESNLDNNLDNDFENAFDNIGKDIEASCKEITARLDNLDF